MKETICGRTEAETKDTLARESELRGHTLSEAVDHVLRLGLPIYLKEFAPQFRRVKKSKQEVAV
jgi:hypothetical protein